VAAAVSGVAMNIASSAKAIPAVNRRSFMGFLPTFPAIFDPPRAGVVKIGRRCCAKGENCCDEVGVSQLVEGI
jgi:hypothetical protein